MECAWNQVRYRVLGKKDVSIESTIVEAVSEVLFKLRDIIVCCLLSAKEVGHVEVVMAAMVGCCGKFIDKEKRVV